MKTLFSKHKWMQLVYGALLIAAGVVVIVIALNQQDQISQWLSIVVSIALFIYAAALMFTGIFSLKKKVFDLAFIYSVVFIAIGVVLLVKPMMIGEFITIFVATLLCAGGVVEIGEATAMVFFKRPLFFIIAFYVLGAALIALGVLCFSFQNDVQKIIYIASGAILALAGAIELALGIYSLFKHKEDEKEEDDEKEEEEKKEAPKEIEDKKSDGVDA